MLVGISPANSLSHESLVQLANTYRSDSWNQQPLLPSNKPMMSQYVSVSYVKVPDSTLSCVPLGVVNNGVLTIGNVSAPLYNPDEKMKVPDVLFYDNPQVITHCPPGEMRHH